jgi:hypothetical protein
MYRVLIGYDPREDDAYQVCKKSILRRASVPLVVEPIQLQNMRDKGLYWRQHERRGNQLWDVISEAPMATEFSISRFLAPFLAPEQWALFVDCDFLFRADIAELFDQADDKYAVMCVKHRHQPSEAVKMDGQIQTQYARKNWSSLMLFNRSHPANERLTLNMVNELPGRDLHRFCWLNDSEIGALDGLWNFIPGVTEPKAVHYSVKAPWFDGQENCDFGDEWRAERKA